MRRGLFALLAALMVVTAVGIASMVPAAPALCDKRPTRPRCVTTTAPTTTTPTGGVCKSGDLFCDDFNGTSLDLSKWQPNWFGATNASITKPVNGAERTCYRPSNSTVSDGTLKLLLQSGSCKADNGTTYPESAGAVTTLRSFSFQDGRLETRVWLPGSSSALYNWPAVWTDGLGTWPHTGESDIMEGLSGHASWHYHSDAGGPGGSVTMGQGWHTFAEEVRNGTTKYYYDGALVGTVSSVKSPHFIIVSEQDGTYGGQQVLPATMMIDYIRVTP